MMTLESQATLLLYNNVYNVLAPSLKLNAWIWIKALNKPLMLQLLSGRLEKFC